MEGQDGLSVGVAVQVGYGGVPYQQLIETLALDSILSSGSKTGRSRSATTASLSASESVSDWLWGSPAVASACWMASRRSCPVAGDTTSRPRAREMASSFTRSTARRTCRST